MIVPVYRLYRSLRVLVLPSIAPGPKGRCATCRFSCPISVFRLLAAGGNRSGNTWGAGIRDEQHGGFVTRLAAMNIVHRLAEGLSPMKDLALIAGPVVQRESA